MKTYKLNEDWKAFEPALRSELKKLGATTKEAEAIVDGAWEAATEVDDVARYAAEELDRLRDPDMPDYK